MTHENAMRWYSFDPFAHVPEGAGHRRRAAPVGRRARRLDHVPEHRASRTPDEKLEGFR